MSDNNHASMCVYCGDSIIYDTREATDMAAAHAQIVEHDQQCPKNPLVALIAELEERGAALAAHVEKVQRLADSDRVDDEFYDEDGDLCTGNGWKSRLGRDLHDVLRKAPATSLDRRDAMMRAQGITDAASRWPPDSATRSRLLELAEDARLKGE